MPFHPIHPVQPTASNLASKSPSLFIVRSKSPRLQYSLLPADLASSNNTLPPLPNPQFLPTVRTIPFRSPTGGFRETHAFEVEPFALALLFCHAVSHSSIHPSATYPEQNPGKEGYRARSRGEELTSLFSQQTIFPKLTSPQRQ